MRKLIVEEWISLDGYVSDKEGKLDFFVKHVRELNTSGYRKEFLNTIDTILLGRKTYDQFVALWPGRSIEEDTLSIKINTVKKIIFSTTLNKAPWGKWKEAEVESGNLKETINILKSMSGGNIVVWGSIMIAQNLIKDDLVDEYHIHLCPIITGGGKKFFTEESSPSPLTLVDVKRYGSGILHLHYKNLSIK